MSTSPPSVAPVVGVILKRFGCQVRRNLTQRLEAGVDEIVSTADAIVCFNISQRCSNLIQSCMIIIHLVYDMTRSVCMWYTTKTAATEATFDTEDLPSRNSSTFSDSLPVSVQRLPFIERIWHNSQTSALLNVEKGRVAAFASQTMGDDCLPSAITNELQMAVHAIQSINDIHVEKVKFFRRYILFR